MGLLQLTNPDAAALSFETEVRFLLGGNTQDSSMPAARIHRLVNDAYDFVTQPYTTKSGGVFCHPELEHTEDVALVAGPAQTTTTVWRRILSVMWIESTHPTAPVSGDLRHALRPMDIDYADLDNLHTGRPALYSWFGNTFYLNAVAETSIVGHTFRVRGYRQPPLLTTTDTTLIRREWDSIICKGAEYFGWLWLGQLDRAQFAKEDFAKLINEQAQAQHQSAVTALGGEVRVRDGEYM